ncbi:MAG: hypothetical protein ACXADL_15630 [Candidatus Thorarchaeota archaeon]
MSTSNRDACITLSLVIVVILAFLFLILPDEYTIRVHYEEWTVKNNVAQRIAKNGSTWTAEGVKLWYHIFFPFDSTDRTIEIKLEVVDGTIDFRFFPNASDFDRYLYSNFIDGALISCINVTEVVETISLEERKPVLVYRSNAGGAWVGGSIIATCILN